MAHEKQISRQAPGLIVFIIDDSGSMGDMLHGTTDCKYLWVERYCGIILKELLARCTEVRGENVVIKPRYYVYEIVYGSSPSVWGDGVMDIETVVEKYAGSGNSLGLKARCGGTDAKSALEMAVTELRGAIHSERFRDSFPPMIFHLTDGESQSDASSAAGEIQQLSTSDGSSLLVNAYIGTHTDLRYNGPDDFPGYVDIAEVGSGMDNQRLFNISSRTPASIHRNLVDDGIFPELRDNARLFFDIRTKEMLKHVIQVVGSLGSRADR